MSTKLQQTVLGDVLLQWRLAAGLNVREVAGLIGISASSLCRIENGKMTPDAKSFLAILNWLMQDKQ